MLKFICRSRTVNVKDTWMNKQYAHFFFFLFILLFIIIYLFIYILLWYSKIYLTDQNWSRKGKKQEAHGSRLSHLIKKSYRISAYTASRTQLRPYRNKVKCHPYVIIWTILTDLEYPMMNTKFSIKAFFALEKKSFKCVYHIWAWQPSYIVVQRWSELTRRGSTPGKPTDTFRRISLL